MDQRSHRGRLGGHARRYLALPRLRLPFPSTELHKDFLMKNMLQFGLIFLLGLITSIPSMAETTFLCSSVTDVPPEECEALVALYNSTNGSGWKTSTNWLVSATVADWYGVTVSDRHVTGLSLQDNLLYGNIPAELGNLSHLVELRLYSNRLNGSIPAELGDLDSLTLMYLSYNALSGSIPAELGDLPNITEIYLHMNGLSGSIPSALGNLTSLRTLKLSNNNLSGAIPPELGQLANLEVLDLSDNALSGTIPGELSDLSSLIILNLQTNQLSGGIPFELREIPNLRTLNLSRNQLSGSIPPELSEFPSLAYLGLSTNALSGPIPPELGKLTSLTNLILFSNELSGSIPPELGNLTYLSSLMLDDNRLEGDVPDTFIKLVNLIDAGWPELGIGLNLDYNRLNVPPDYPNPDDPFDVFLELKDFDWQWTQAIDFTVTPDGGEFASRNGLVTFLFPTGAVDGNTIFSFIPQLRPSYEAVRLSYMVTNFLLSAEDTAGVPVTEFNLPITVTINHYPVTGIREETLALYYWDEDISTWVDAITTCPGTEYTHDMVANLLSLPLCHLTEFSLYGSWVNVFLPAVMR